MQQGEPPNTSVRNIPGSQKIGCLNAHVQTLIEKGSPNRCLKRMLLTRLECARGEGALVGIIDFEVNPRERECL